MMFSKRTPLRASLALVLLFACAGAFAQQAAIEQQMTPEEFKAAGLDKLSPQELANLNAWLNHTVQAETAKAKVDAKKNFENDNRGFIHFGSDQDFEAHIVGEFRGFAEGRTYVLDNGQEWEQVDGASLAGVRKTNPEVKLSPGVIGNTWWLRIKGYNTQAKVKRVK
jgi:hypothetical protein